MGRDSRHSADISLSAELFLYVKQPGDEWHGTLFWNGQIASPESEGGSPENSPVVKVLQFSNQLIPISRGRQQGIELTFGDVFSRQGKPEVPLKYIGMAWPKIS